MRLFQIGSNQVVKIDDADAEMLSKFSWCFDGRYAYCFLGERKVYMHQMLCDADLVDHDDQDKLNNQRHNLKASTKSLNALNRKGVKGIHYNKNAKKWEAYVFVDGVKRYLGLYVTQESASIARQQYLAFVRKQGEQRESS